MSERLPETRCLLCNTKVDASTQLAGEGGPDVRPGVGSFSVCGYCGALAMYDERLHLVPLDNDHLEYLASHPAQARMIMLAQRACVKMRSMRN